MANPIPNHTVPVLNKDGTMDTNWYEFLKGIKLSSLPDVQLTALANGDAPVWNAVAGKWTNQAN